MIHGADLFPELPDLVSFFAFRGGGVSNPPFASLNLGVSCGDDPPSVEENRSRLATHLAIPRDAWIVPRQVHGADVARISGPPTPADDPVVADAIVLLRPGVFALSLSADCPLVALVDPRSGLAGVAHAGWRGTAGGVVTNLLSALVEEGVDPVDLRAAVSPGICGACYEVGSEVVEAVSHLPGAELAITGRQLDLRTLHVAALTAGGVPAGSIQRSSLCSFETPGHLFSHRRDRGRSGRSGLVLGWRADSSIDKPA